MSETAEKREPFPVTCWGFDGRPGECDATIPDTNFETMQKHGWGWVWTRDPGAASGMGYYFACPDHKDPNLG